jgi:hypothetical protein
MYSYCYKFSMKFYPGWTRKIVKLNLTKNTMICVSRDDGEWFYFSKNSYGSFPKAMEASNEFMSNYQRNFILK